MKKIIMNKLVIATVFLLIATAALLPITIAHGSEDFAKAENIIEQKIPCEQLTDEDLELLGDYYMEQMHPGEAHEVMDEMMGGEGSETLREMHIRMAKAFYCGEHETMSQEMMSAMMGNNGMMSNGISNGMMNMMNNNMMGGGNMMNYGMMGGYGLVGMTFLWLLWLIIGTFIFGIIFWWTYNIIVPANKKIRKHKTNE